MLSIEPKESKFLRGARFDLLQITMDTVTLDEEIVIMLSKLSPQDYQTFSSYSCGNDGGSKFLFYFLFSPNIYQHYTYINLKLITIILYIYLKKNLKSHKCNLRLQ